MQRLGWVRRPTKEGWRLTSRCFWSVHRRYVLLWCVMADLTCLRLPAFSVPRLRESPRAVRLSSEVIRDACPFSQQVPQQDVAACPFGFSKIQLPAADLRCEAATAAVASTLAAILATNLSGMPITFYLLAASCCLLASKAIWDQYSLPFRFQGLPPADMGKPLIGYSLERLAGGPSDEKGFFRRMRQQLGPAFMTYFGFQPVVVVDYSVYEKHLLDLERKGELIPMFPDSFSKLLGPNSVLMLPAGAQHANLRRRLMAALSPKQVVRRQHEIEARCRAALEAMVEETKECGQTALVPRMNRFTLEVATAFVIGKMEEAELEKLIELLPAALAGVSVFPQCFECFGLSPWDEAVNARRQAAALIDDLLMKAKVSSERKEENVLRALSLPSADGDALSAEEIKDTILTVAMAGSLTTALAIPAAVVQLSNHPEWINICAAPLNRFETGIEDASRPVLQFIRESMRFKVPVSGYRRAQPSEWTSIGEYEVPPGMAITTSVDALGCPLNGLIEHSTEYLPERWADPQFVADNFLFFGGKQPHSCPGKSVALVEMQLFLQMLCQDYDFEVLSQETAPDSFANLNYKDGLPMRVRRKADLNLSQFTKVA